MALDLERIPNEFDHRYVPNDALADWNELEPLFDELNTRPVATAADLERTILDLSDLLDAVVEEGAVRDIRMTCDTTDLDHENAHLHFISEIEPRVKEQVQRLQTRFVGCPAWTKLDPRYAVLKRQIENAIALFRDENLPLEVEDCKLGQRYEKLAGAMTVEYDGKEQTLQQMERYLEEPDRATRAQAWEKTVERRLQDRDETDAIFAELVGLHVKRSANAGFASFVDYAFRDRERFDYTPQHCARFHKGVEQHIVPLLRECQKRRAQAMGLDLPRPWDLLADPEGRPPLRPFTASAELVAGCTAVFRKVDPELGAQFARMADLGLLDLDSRKGKAPGAYQSTLARRRLPFIFMNAVGRDDDLWTLLHEGGHAFHVFATQSEPVYAYRDSPVEFAEVAATGMELLSEPHIGLFYTPDDAARAREERLYAIVRDLAWVATIDAFQHWIYTHPDHTAAERREAWLSLGRRFGGIEDWSGYEEAQANDWQRQTHLFLDPFYYIEYGIAELGALGIWLQAKDDPAQAVRNYRNSLALGGSRPLPDLFRAAGIPFDFGPEAVGRAADGLGQALLGQS